MKQIRSLRHADQASVKMWPLVGALTAVGLASAILGGCAMMDSEGSYSGATEPQIRPMPLITRSNKSPDGHYALGKYYFYQGRLEQAGVAFLEAIRLDPGHVDALNGLGVVYDRLGLYDSARKAYGAALLKDPQAAHVWANLGYSLILAGNSNESIAALQKAVGLDPANVVARQHLASASASASAEAAGTVVTAPPANPVQIVATASDTAASPPREGLVANVVTAKGIATVEAKSPRVSALPTALPSAAGVPNKLVQATPGRQAEPVVYVASIPAKETLNQPHPVIASVAKQSQYDGGSIKHEIVSSPSASQGWAKQNLPKAPATGQQAASEVKAMPVASRTEVRTSGMLGGLRIEVSNGNGVTGMARAVGTEMRQTGLNIARITNARPFNKPQTLIMCRPELKSVAMELARSMPARPKVMLSDITHRNVDVRVVLGADSALALKDGPKSPDLVASLGR